MVVGTHCKACDMPLYEDNDPELCWECMAVVFQYNRDLFEEDEDSDNFDVTELMDIDNITEEI